MGHYVTLLTVLQDPELPHIEEYGGYTIIRYDPVVAPLSNNISSGLAQYLPEAADFDVIHTHSNLYPTTDLAALNRRLGDTPLAITNQGLYTTTVEIRSLHDWTGGCYRGTLGS